MVRSVSFRKCWIATAIWAAALSTASARAGTGSVVSLPEVGAKVTTGLNVQVNTEWLDGNGYRPVTISISPLGGGAAPADRTLEVILSPRNWQWRSELITVSSSIKLEQGQTVASKTIGVPQFQQWGSIKVETYEDGRRCRDLCAEGLGIAWSGNTSWSEAAPTILIIDSDVWQPGSLPVKPTTAVATADTKKEKRPELLPDFRSLASLFSIEDAGNGLTAADIDVTEPVDDIGLVSLLNKLNRFHIVRPGAVPSNWVQLTSIDIIFVSMRDLQLLHGNSERWEALRRWLSTGPTLCVYGVGEDFSGIPELERLFQLDAAPRNDRGSSSDNSPTSRWMSPRVADYANEVHSIRGVQWNNQRYMPTPVPQAAPNTRRTGSLKPDNPKPFLIRGVDHGRLVAFADANPFPGKREEWCWLFNTLSTQDWMWYQRHGMSQSRENPQYWNLLIPGVGSAPVSSFLVLISLFVIVIGPVNYFMLQQRRRLYLLLLTVPLGAGVITCALFCYALVSDGLGVRVRARSLTHIDQTNGRTVSWSRQSYYAGLAPSAGMSYPVDAAIFPLDHRPTGHRGEPRELGRRIRWGSEQRLMHGYLNSRSTSQVMVIESRDTNLVIDVDEPAAGSTTPHVTNRLGVDIEQLLLCSSDGRSLACGKLPPERSVQLHAIDEEEFRTRWNSLFMSNRLQFPIGFDPNQVENASALFGNSYRWWQRIDNGLPEPTTATSVLERGLRNVSDFKVNAMRPRSYIAIVRQAPNASLGIESVAEEASFHVVTGDW